ncbi:unnamed protein product (macronuclear) [Paramecium tetraurelia]|uniref:Jacalin-type lectin domain-containing protein n=1 Tax=Paramecium tetraurelia TaxID=5888 RepID=A0DR65_PARTE|nr:uncharacterized protein GSPATT00019249001 [Paramecium tetraurelia]CAK85532.1 unnamed protein product [Paramecium tetraurelia]|eukprot:XP_001452929.1 hypothetical protein (macronuclear) [Paramecium tetraurelia strain d4-2]
MAKKLVDGQIIIELVAIKTLKKIGGGHYNEQGKKDVRWTDMCESLPIKHPQTIFCGEYQRGEKIGLLGIYGIIKNWKYSDNEVWS